MGAHTSSAHRLGDGKAGAATALPRIVGRMSWMRDWGAREDCAGKPVTKKYGDQGYRRIAFGAKFSSTFLRESGATRAADADKSGGGAMGAWPAGGMHYESAYGCAQGRRERNWVTESLRRQRRN